MRAELNYKDFLVEDFIWDPAFRKWVLNPVNDSNIFWIEWQAANPQKKEIVLAARQLVKAIQVKSTSISDDEVQFAIQSVLQKLI